MLLPSPQYIRSVTVNNQSLQKYNIWFEFDFDNLPSNQFNICCCSKKTYEFTYQDGGATFVKPITYLKLRTNWGCGEQTELYSLKASQVSGVVNVILNIDYAGRVTAIIQ